MQNVTDLKRQVAKSPKDWKEKHMTSQNWRPSTRYSPDPNNGWNNLVESPEGTDPNTARNNFILYMLFGIQTSELYTSAIGSFRIIATADNIDLLKCHATINVWMYNEMSRRSFGRFANYFVFRYRPMASQFMWWNWKETFKFDSLGNIVEDNSVERGW